MPISIIIPAHNEEAVIARSLGALLRDARPGELEVIVACNGCSDRTAEIARGFEPAVKVVETPTASKVAALNLGDGAATGWPRIYMDADVVLETDAVRRVAEALESGRWHMASPRLEMDLDGCSWPVRAYYRVWTQLPYTRGDIIGTGVYALSRDGRERFGDFPEVIADDGYVRILFRRAERAVLDSCVSRVRGPADLSGLLKIKTRSRRGLHQLRERYPDLVARDQAEKDYGGALRRFALRPAMWPSLAVYLAVNFWTRRRARAQALAGGSYVWERDESSREGTRIMSPCSDEQTRECRMTNHTWITPE